MNCDEARRLLEAYVDRELDRAAVDEIEAHLTSCERCRVELAALEALHSRIAQAPRYKAPPELRRRLEALDELPAQTEGVRSRTVWPKWAMAASLLLSFAFGATVTWLYARNAELTSRRQMFADDLLNGHLRALAAASPVDVISEDRHTVKPWFAGKVDVAPTVVDLASDGFPLVGGRIDYVGGQRTPVVVYRRRQHVIDVYWMPEARPPAAETQRQGYWLSPCRVDGRAVQIVADVDQQELRQFCSLLSRRVSPQTATSQ
ncbi:MAG TPA: zf-HC2 domain-containing protein [Steroidobacteraceae bacterium]|nr:zf-HC2 domain-containing protein [Steroidobacteraceae bacterium]